MDNKTTDALPIGREDTVAKKYVRVSDLTCLMRSSQIELLCSIEPIRVALTQLTNSGATSRAPLSASATMTSRNCWAIRFHSLKTLPAATTDQSVMGVMGGVVFEVRSLKQAGRRVYSLI